MDRGELVKLDSSIDTHCVSKLREILAQSYDIPVERQILLVSGGFQPEPGEKLCDIGAVLDQTDPIYVFTQLSHESMISKPAPLQVVDAGLCDEISCLINARASVETLERRIEPVKKLASLGKEAAEVVDKLVFEQRLMIQGWCAALANLAEVSSSVNKRLQSASSQLLQFEANYAEWEHELAK